MTAERKRLVFIIVAPLVVLLIPLVAMQFSSEVNWTMSDFVIAGILLFGTGILFEIVIRKMKEKKYRIILIVAIIVILLLVWAELAVGIFGTPLAGS